MMQSYSGHGTGGSGGVDYPEEEETARVLLGDKETTKELIRNNSNKRKYSSGIITFEEANPPKEVVQDVIDNFLKHTFAGLDQEQYNCYMVEHTNTDNYHIHFYIPRLELTSGKAYNPHWHVQDQTLLLKFQDYMNAKHGLTNPYSAAKRRTLADIDTKALNRNETKEEVNKHIEELVIAQKLQNRDEVVEYFKESGIDVVRQSKNFITIQLGEERIRLKGTYYAETFTDIEAVGAELERAEREHTATTPAELEKLEREFNELVEYKAKQNREKYPNVKQDNDRELGLRVGDTKKEQVVQVHRDSSNQLDNRLNSDIFSDEAKPSTKQDDSRDRGEEIHNSKVLRNGKKQPRGNEPTTNQGIDNDTIRANASRRIRERERAEQFTLGAVGAEPSGVYKRVAEDFKRSQETNRENARAIQSEFIDNYRETYGQLQAGLGGLNREVDELHTERESRLSSLTRAISDFGTRTKELAEQLIEKVTESAKEYIAEQVHSKPRRLR